MDQDELCIEDNEEIPPDWPDGYPAEKRKRFFDQARIFPNNLFRKCARKGRTNLCAWLHANRIIGSVCVEQAFIDAANKGHIETCCWFEKQHYCGEHAKSRRYVDDAAACALSCGHVITYQRLVDELNANPWPYCDAFSTCNIPDDDWINLCHWLFNRHNATTQHSRPRHDAVLLLRRLFTNAVFTDKICVVKLFIKYSRIDLSEICENMFDNLLRKKRYLTCRRFFNLSEVSNHLRKEMFGRYTTLIFHEFMDTVRSNRLDDCKFIHSLPNAVNVADHEDAIMHGVSAGAQQNVCQWLFTLPDISIYRNMHYIPKHYSAYHDKALCVYLIKQMEQLPADVIHREILRFYLS